MTTATGTAEDSDPVEDKRVQADVADIASSAGRTPVYDAVALAAFLRGVAPMMEQEIKRGAKSTALRCDTAQLQAAQAVIFCNNWGQGLERRVGTIWRHRGCAACTAFAFAPRKIVTLSCKVLQTLAPKSLSTAASAPPDATLPLPVVCLSWNCSGMVKHDGNM